MQRGTRNSAPGGGKHGKRWGENGVGSVQHKRGLYTRAAGSHSSSPPTNLMVSFASSYINHRLFAACFVPTPQTTFGHHASCCLVSMDLISCLHSAIAEKSGPLSGLIAAQRDRRHDLQVDKLQEMVHGMVVEEEEEGANAPACQIHPLGCNIP